MPNTTFSQNNGVIALTKCASRRAGFACACWLIFMGVFSKIAGMYMMATVGYPCLRFVYSPNLLLLTPCSGVITSIPDAVLGGMTIFLFANVLASGVSLAATLDLNSRRNKFIMAMSLAVGVGVTVWPFAFQDMRASNYTANFWRCGDCSDTMKGIRNGVAIFLSTGYCVGTVVAMLLNFILPGDAGVSMPTADELADEDGVKKGGTQRMNSLVTVPMNSQMDFTSHDMTSREAEEGDVIPEEGTDEENSKPTTTD